MNEIRWTFGIVIGLISLWAIADNWWCVICGFRSKKTRSRPIIPLVGGIIGAATLLLIPIPGLSNWWWVPLLIDVGSIPGMGIELYLYLRRHSRGYCHESRIEVDEQSANSDSGTGKE